MKLIEKFGELIGKAIHDFIIGAILCYVYNEIALGFDLPSFNYWVCLGFYYVFKKLQK